MRFKCELSAISKSISLGWFDLFQVRKVVAYRILLYAIVKLWCGLTARCHMYGQIVEMIDKLVHRHITNSDIARIRT